MPLFNDIPQLTRAKYHVNYGWDYLADTIFREVDHYGLDVNPNFQRARVWTVDQKVSYVEYMLRGGTSGRDIYTNCPGHHFGRVGPNYVDGWYVLVDGKQRLDAALGFLNNEFKIFGKWYYRDYTDRMRFTVASFNWHVGDLQTIEEVYQWYLDLNSGGTVHTETDLTKVRILLDNKVPYTRVTVEEAAVEVGLNTRQIFIDARAELAQKEADQKAATERAEQQRLKAIEDKKVARKAKRAKK